MLRGAPSIVTSVDRRVTADANRPAEFFAPEVARAIELLALRGPVGDAPWYDASALRRDDEKLGLGSSAAICVSCTAALLIEQKRALGEAFSSDDIFNEVYPVARRAHRLAQGGGSGIDVAASCFGGTLIATLPADDPDALPSIEPVSLPLGLCFEVWGFQNSASTADFVRRVFALERVDRVAFDAFFATLESASTQAVRAVRSGDPNDFVAALRLQALTLEELGKRAGVPIVLPEVSTLFGLVNHDSCFLPSGAGGGDVNLYVGPMRSSASFREKAQEMGLFEVPLTLATPGVTWPHPSQEPPTP